MRTSLAAVVGIGYDCDCWTGDLEGDNAGEEQQRRQGSLCREGGVGPYQRGGALHSTAPEGHGKCRLRVGFDASLCPDSSTHLPISTSHISKPAEPVSEVSFTPHVCDARA